MHESESSLPVTVWLEDVKGGDDRAFAQLWSQYYSRLVSLARKRMSTLPSGIADEEDVVNSALASFYYRARDGLYPDLRDRHELWKLLITITLTKARALARKESRRREILEREYSGMNFAQGEPAPEFAIEVADQLRQLLNVLPDALLRDIAVAKLEGCTNRDIATRVGKTIPTVERKLRLIRAAWADYVF